MGAYMAAALQYSIVRITSMKLLPTAAVVLGLSVLIAGQAHATLQITADVNGTTETAFDNNIPLGTQLDTNGTLGIIDLGSITVGGVIVNSSTSTASGTTIPAVPGGNQINVTSLAIINTNAFAVTISAALGATNFAGPANSYSVSGSGTFQNANGATATNSWYDDPINRQGAVAGDCTLLGCTAPGMQLNTDNFTASGSPSSYSFNHSGAVTDPGLFSMTLTVDVTLPAGTGDCLTGTTSDCPELVSRGQAEQKTFAATPEPASLAVLGTGLVGFGLIRRRLRG
jgi:hypothetical protein